MSNKTLYEYRVVNADESISKGEVLVDSDQVDPEQTARDLAIASFIGDNPDTTITDVVIVVRPFLDAVVEQYGGTIRWNPWDREIAPKAMRDLFDQQRTKIAKQAENPDTPFSVGTRVKSTITGFLGRVIALCSNEPQMVQVKWDNGSAYVQWIEYLEVIADEQDVGLKVGARVKWNPAAFKTHTPHNERMAAKRGTIVDVFPVTQLVQVQWDDGELLNQCFEDMVRADMDTEHDPNVLFAPGDRVVYTVKIAQGEKYYYGNYYGKVVSAGLGVADVDWDYPTTIPPSAHKRPNSSKWHSYVPIKDLVSAPRSEHE